MAKKKLREYVVEVPIETMYFVDVEALDKDEAIEQAKQLVVDDVHVPRGRADWEKSTIADQFSIVEFCVSVPFVDSQKFYVEACDVNDAVKQAKDQHKLEDRYEMSEEDILIEENSGEHYRWDKVMISKN